MEANIHLQRLVLIVISLKLDVFSTNSRQLVNSRAIFCQGVRVCMG